MEERKKEKRKTKIDEKKNRWKNEEIKKKTVRGNFTEEEKTKVKKKEIKERKKRGKRKLCKRSETQCRIILLIVLSFYRLSGLCNAET